MFDIPIELSVDGAPAEAFPALWGAQIGGLRFLDANGQNLLPETFKPLLGVDPAALPAPTQIIWVAGDVGSLSLDDPREFTSDFLRLAQALLNAWNAGKATSLRLGSDGLFPGDELHAELSAVFRDDADPRFPDAPRRARKSILSIDGASPALLAKHAALWEAAKIEKAARDPASDHVRRASL